MHTRGKGKFFSALALHYSAVAGALNFRRVVRRSHLPPILIFTIGNLAHRNIPRGRVGRLRNVRLQHVDRITPVPVALEGLFCESYVNLGEPAFFFLASLRLLSLGLVIDRASRCQGPRPSLERVHESQRTPGRLGEGTSTHEHRDDGRGKKNPI